MTSDEFLRLHGDESGIELVNGEVVRLPMTGGRHGEVCGHAAFAIGSFVKGNKLGRMATNHTFIVTGPTNVRGADVLFVSYAILPASVPTPVGAITPPLELVVEVRSPTDNFADLDAKADEYLRAGVRVVMVLDPETESAGVYRLNELSQRFHNGDVVTLTDVLPGFAVPVGKFFE